MSKCKSIIILLCVIMPIYIQSGCASLTGYGLGSVIDNASKSYTMRPVEEIPYLKEGSKIIIFKTDSTIDSGLYYGRHILQDSLYRLYYKNSTDKKPYPKYESPVKLTLIDNQTEEGLFWGFDLYQNSRLHSFNQKYSGTFKPVNVIIKDETMQSLDYIPLDRLLFIEDSEGVYDAQIMKNEANEQKIFLKSYIRFFKNGQEERIHLNEIKLLESEGKSSARWVGLGIGIAIDVIMIIVAIDLSDESFGWGNY